MKRVPYFTLRPIQNSLYLAYRNFDIYYFKISHDAKCKNFDI